MMAARIEWELLDAEPEYGPPCPDTCEAGPESHIWRWTWSAFDGSTLTTAECPICDRGVNHLMGDWPHEYLSIDLDVTLESFTERYGWETPEYDHYVVMTPSPAWSRETA